MIKFENTTIICIEFADDMPIIVTIANGTGFLIASCAFDLIGSDCANKICKAICHNCSL